MYVAGFLALCEMHTDLSCHVCTPALSVDRNSSQGIARSAVFLPDLAIRQEQTAVY